VVMYAMGHGLHHQSAPRIAAPEDRWRPAAYPCYPVVSTDIDRRPDDGKCYTSWRGMAPRFRGYSAGYKPYYAYLKDGQGYNIFLAHWGRSSLISPSAVHRVLHTATVMRP